MDRLNGLHISFLVIYYIEHEHRKSRPWEAVSPSETAQGRVAAAEEDRERAARESFVHDE